MLDHVRGDRLDQRKYPWVSLTQAAIYLISPDDKLRMAAIRSHDWEMPFKLLRELIEGGKITVYEAWDEPFKSIPKQEFFGVPIKYPSYPDDRQESIRRAYQPGGGAFIECNLLTKPSSLPARDRYFVRGKREPRWRDLKIQSQELVAVFEAANIEASAEFKAFAEIEPAQPDDDTGKRSRRKTELVDRAITELFPTGIPEELPNAELIREVMKWAVTQCKKNNLAPPIISDSTILRAAGRKDKPN
jgi:hypothetical protein